MAIWIALHFKINYFLSYLVFYSAQVIIFRKEAESLFKAIGYKVKSGIAAPGEVAIIVFSLVVLIITSVTYYGWDDLVSHLYIPKVVSLFGFFNFNQAYPYGLDQAIIPKSSYISVFLLGKENAIRILIYMLYVLSLFSFESLVRKQFGKFVALYSTLALLSTPFLVWQLSTVFIDLFSFYVPIVLLILLFDTLKRITLKNSAALVSACLISYVFKQQNIIVAIPILIVYLYHLNNSLNINKTAKKGIHAGILIGLIFIIPLLLQNYILTKNPLFPYFNRTFKSNYFTQEDLFTKMPFWNIFKIFYDLTFNGGNPRYFIPAANYSFGFLYFIFLCFSPLLLLFKKHYKQIAATLFVFVSGVILWLYVLTGPQIRYFITCLPLGSLLIGLIVLKVIELTKEIRLSYRITLASIILLYSINIVCLNQFSYQPQPYPLLSVIGVNDRDKSYTIEDVRMFFEIVAKEKGKDIKCLMFYSPAMYFADFKIEIYDWYNYNTQKVLSLAKDPVDLSNIIFDQCKFDYIILTKDRPPTNLDGLIECNLLKEELTVKNYTLYGLKKKSIK